LNLFLQSGGETIVLESFQNAHRNLLPKIVIHRDMVDEFPVQAITLRIHA
jgi:hypothetical protein